LKEFLDLFPRDINNLRILDVGFGCGQLMHTVVAYGNRNVFHLSGIPYIIGLDIDSKNVEFAKKYMPYYRETYLCDATEIPYPKEIISDLGIIVCTEMVEHTTDKDKTLRMIKYLSDKAKLVIFMCPYGDTLSNKNKGFDYDNHNTIWYDADFSDLGFNVKIIKKVYWSGWEYKIASAVLDVFNVFKPYNKNITKRILAWKRN